MSERAYTVKEIDELRKVCKDRYLWGTSVMPNLPAGQQRNSRSYRESDMSIDVEQQIRTYMLAGITAADIINSDAEKQGVYV